jgi:hypothetical protein
MLCRLSFPQDLRLSLCPRAPFRAIPQKELPRYENRMNAQGPLSPLTSGRHSPSSVWSRRWQRLCVVYGFRARLLTPKQRPNGPITVKQETSWPGMRALRRWARGRLFPQLPPGWPLAKQKLSPFWLGSFIGLCAPRTTERYVTRPCRRIGRLPVHSMTTVQAGGPRRLFQLTRPALAVVWVVSS